VEQHATVELVPALRAPHAARAFAAETLAAWDVRAEEIEAVQLVASELVTNAVLHAAESQTVTLQLVMIDGCVRVMVSDGGRGEPERRSPADRPVAESGRGVWIVDALADHWGTETNERGGKTVWCEMSTRPATTR
jgi:anti-sigma regulatory factor (Ser/Thr protein kinase)